MLLEISYDEGLKYFFECSDVVLDYDRVIIRQGTKTQEIEYFFDGDVEDTLDVEYVKLNNNIIWNRKDCLK